MLHTASASSVRVASRPPPALPLGLSLGWFTTWENKVSLGDMPGTKPWSLSACLHLLVWVLGRTLQANQSSDFDPGCGQASPTEATKERAGGERDTGPHLLPAGASCALSHTLASHSTSFRQLRPTPVCSFSGPHRTSLIPSQTPAPRGQCPLETHSDPTGNKESLLR